MLFATRDNDGKTGFVSVTPLLVSADGTRLQVQVPDLATTGEVRVVNHGTDNLGGASSNTDSVYRRISVDFVAGSDTAMLAAEDNRTIAENAAREADSFRINAQNYRADAAGARAAGANARTAGLINAGTTLLNRATQIGGQFAKYGGAQKSYAPRIFG